MSEAILNNPRQPDQRKRTARPCVTHIWTIAKREISGYFASPVAYVFIVIFLLLAGFFTFMVGGFFERGRRTSTPSSPGIRGFICFWFRRSACACGRKNGVSGTIELLLTMPITPWQAIVGKFLASWLFLASGARADLPDRHHGQLPRQSG